MTARQHLKPLVLFPRLASLGEHRNDHQLATTAALAGRPGIAIATRIDELRVYLETPPRSPTEANAPASQRQLCDTIVDFIKQAQVEGSRHV